MSDVFAIIEAAGWPIWPLILCSVLAVAIILERGISLRAREVAPAHLLQEAIRLYLARDPGHGVSAAALKQLAARAPLGRILAATLRYAPHGRLAMKNAAEEIGTSVGHELERFLTALGTIASMAPLLGLLGTVIGMIEIFGAQSASATGTDPAQLARGISIALYNTAFGLIVAIPAMAFYRHFRARVDLLVITLEQQTLHLIEAILDDGRQALSAAAHPPTP